VKTGERLGPYVLLNELGKGGMGAVFKARHVGSGKLVAIKVMAGLLDETDVKRFLREAQAGASIEHENVIRVLETGRHEGTPFIVHELAEGGSLEARLLAAGRLPWRDAATIGAAIARGLAAIHEKGLVHRDLKPSNVLFDASGRPRIADLGLVKTLEAGTNLTETSVIVGTPAFMSPEQATEQSVDGRSDLYSLGCVLHALVTGAPPFPGRDYGVMRRHVTAAPSGVRELVPDVPRAFEALVLDLLSKRPEQRGDALGVARALEVLAGTAKAAPRRPRGVVVAALVAAVVVPAFALHRLGASGGRDAVAPVSSDTAIDEPELGPPPPVAPIVSSLPANARAESQEGTWRFVKAWGRRAMRHPRPIDCMAITGDGGRLLTSCGNGARHLTLWDVPSGEAIDHLVGRDTKTVTAVAFSAAGDLAAYGDVDGKVFLLRRVRRDHLKNSEEAAHHHAGIIALAFSRSGKTLYSVGADGSIGTTDVRAHKVNEVPAVEGKIASASISLDRTAVAEAAEGRVRLVPIGDPVAGFTCGDAELFTCLSSRAAVLATNDSLRLFRKGVADQPLGTMAFRVVALAVSSDESRIAVATADNVVSLHDTGGREIWRTRSPVRARLLAFSEGGSALAAAVDCEVRVFDVAHGEPEVADDEPAGPALGVMANGARFVSSSSDGVLRFFDVAGGLTKRIYTGVFFGRDQAQVTRDGRRVLAIDGEQRAVLYDTRDGSELWRDSRTSWRAILSPDGTRAVAVVGSGAASEISVLALPGGQRLRTISMVRNTDQDYAGQHVLAVAPDMRRIVVNKDGALDLVDLEATNRRPVDMPGGGACFSRDGRLLATDKNGEVTLRDGTGRPIGGPWKVHGWGVGAMLFSKDGKHLYVAAYDDMVTIWNVTTATQEDRIVFRWDTPTGLWVSDDERRLVVGTVQGRVLLYEHR
jgi:WD40 repeat protein